jgi:hypothetical protein
MNITKNTVKRVSEYLYEYRGFNLIKTVSYSSSRVTWDFRNNDVSYSVYTLKQAKRMIDYAIDEHVAA